MVTCMWLFLLCVALVFLLRLVFLAFGLVAGLVTASHLRCLAFGAFLLLMLLLGALAFAGSVSSFAALKTLQTPDTSHRRSCSSSVR